MYLDDQVLSLGYFEGKLEKAIHSLKFQQNTSLAKLMVDNG
ncbi:MAG: hypothetical protein R2880_21505 [Deinococcales bacterium]